MHFGTATPWGFVLLSLLLSRNLVMSPHFGKTLAAVMLVLGLIPAMPCSAQGLLDPWGLKERGPQTLLRWWDAGEEEFEVHERIITDRPHIAEAATTVGLGHVQIETGYTYYLDRDAGTRVQTHSYPETLFRIGMFQEWFEFRIAYNYLSQQTDSSAGRVRVGGSDDLYLGAKVALAKQSGILPELTIFPQMKVPSGGSAFTAGQVLPGVNFVYAWHVTDKFELECNTQVNKRLDDDDHFYTEYLQTVNFEFDLNEKFMVFNEFVLFSPVGSHTNHVEWYTHPGVHYFILPNVQLDVHAAVGLNRSAIDMFGGSGLSWRW